MLRLFSWELFRFEKPLTEPGKLGLIVLLCTLWLMLGLAGHDPWKQDDAIGPINHIVKSGDWVVPVLAGEAFLTKPPLYYVTAASFADFIPWLTRHDAMRLASGFYMALTLFFISLTGRELWGRGHGRVSALILIGSVGLIVHSHEMITETALLAGLAMAFYGLTFSVRRSVTAGLFIGTGIG
ncbi:MAG: ArnT family glycosyltransferase, partial [Burkholderiales bacterium]